MVLCFSQRAVRTGCHSDFQNEYKSKFSSCNLTDHIQAKFPISLLHKWFSEGTESNTSLLDACYNPKIQPSQVSCPRRVGRYPEEAWVIIRLLGKREDTNISKGSCNLVHREHFRGHNIAPELESTAELSKQTGLVDQLEGSYVFLYLIYSMENISVKIEKSF